MRLLLFSDDRCAPMEHQGMEREPKINGIGELGKLTAGRLRWSTAARWTSSFTANWKSARTEPSQASSHARRSACATKDRRLKLSHNVPNKQA
jgi:hypothetical protein